MTLTSWGSRLEREKPPIGEVHLLSKENRFSGFMYIESAMNTPVGQLAGGRSGASSPPPHGIRAVNDAYIFTLLLNGMAA